MVLLQFGVLIAPYGLPVLPLQYLKLYAGFLAEYFMLDAPLRNSGQKLEQIPYVFSGMLGWKEKSDAVAKVYHSLDTTKQEACVIEAGNSALAAALQFYGVPRGLPQPVSQMGSYMHWGPGKKAGEVSIAVGISKKILEQQFRHVRLAEEVSHPYLINPDNYLAIYLCEEPRLPCRSDGNYHSAPNLLSGKIDTFVKSS